MADAPLGLTSGLRVAVLADTHVPVRARDLPPTAWELIAASDAAIHAGDVIAPRLLDDLGAVVPTYAVRGNNDHEIPDSVPERLEIELGGVAVAVVHDAGLSHGRRSRLRGWFPDARVVVYGHSHIPFLEDDGDLLMFNPGSPPTAAASPRSRWRCCTSNPPVRGPS